MRENVRLNSYTTAKGGHKTKKLYQGFKIPIYPTSQQQLVLQKFFNAKIIAYNWGLETQRKILNAKKKLLNQKELTAAFVDKTKKSSEFTWMRDLGISRHMFYYAFDDLNNTLHDYLTHEKAFKNKYAGSPKFKSTRDTKKTFGQRNDMKLIVSDNQVQVAKLGKIYADKELLSRVGKIYKPNQLVSIRFTFDGDNYYVSFNKRIVHPDLVTEGKSIGIDLGIKTWATSSEGINLSYPEKRLKPQLKKLRQVNQKIAHSNPSTKHRQKLYANRRKITRHITAIMRNLIQNYISELLGIKPRKIVMENLAVKGMNRSPLWNHKLKYSQFRYFRDEMEYRCTREGIEFVLADRFYPSSQICSNCGHKQKMTLDKRVYKCPKCRQEIDRDLNAAINLSKF